LIVVDGELSLIDGVELPSDGRIRVISNLPRKGLAAGRNTGCRAITSELVALLDDDDTWLPEKIALQVAVYKELRSQGHAFPVVTCKWQVQRPDGSALRVSPRRLIGSSQSVADYLLVRREVRPDAAVIGPSMTLCGADLFAKYPYNEAISRHEDWDWLLRVDTDPGSAFRAVDQVLATYTRQDPSNSLSVGPDWGDSLEWAESHRAQLSVREYSDFLLTVTAPIALTHGDWSGSLRISSRALRVRGGSAKAWAFFLAHFLLSAGRHARYSLEMKARRKVKQRSSSEG
jgi:glycosyltransferase involved in cell wall biosynthesis